MKKLASNKGETIVETLLSVMICVFVILMLVSSIMTASRVNSKMNNETSSVDLSEATMEDHAASVKIEQYSVNGAGQKTVTSTITDNATLHKVILNKGQSNEYTYYYYE